MDSSIDIEQRAAEWLAQRDGGRWSMQHQAELDVWLKSTANRVAYIRLDAALRKMGRLRALGAGTRPGVMPDSAEWTLSPFFQARHGVSARRSRTQWLGWVAGAAVTAVVIGGAWILMPEGKSYRTPIGSTQAIHMTDGSRITLNTDSKVRIEVTGQERRIELDRGEAFFEVAKDATRPFVVVAGRERVIAVGTQFSVRRDDEGLRVTVTEGRVRIEGPAAPAAEIPAGALARSSGEGVLIQAKTVEEAEQDLSWRSGYLMFRGMPLREAVAEFNRYNERKIVIDDPALAEVLIGGNFRSTNVEAFLRLLNDGFAIRWEERDGQIFLRDAAP